MRHIETSKGTAKFHAWGDWFQLVNGVPMQITVAIVEFDDGTCGRVNVQNVKFVEDVK